MALRWLTAARFVGQLVAWTITLLVIRLLSPEDYGLMALGITIIGFFALLNEIGLGASLVQREAIDRRLIEQVYGIVLVFNAGLYAAVFLTAPLVAVFFNEPELRSIVRVLGLQVLLMAFMVVPDAMLQRRMDFRRKAIADFGAMLAASAATLILAHAGYGVWSLVFGSLLQFFVKAAAINFAVRCWYRPRFSFSGMRETISFGGLVTLDRILWFLYSQADVFIIGKLLGKQVLGFYSVAMHLASLPMQKIGGILNEIGFAAFARTQHDRRRVGAHLCKVVRLISFVAFPVFFGISSVAPEIVHVFLGSKWEAAIVPLQLLSLVVPIRMAANATTPALFGVGRPDIGVKALVIGCLLMPAAFLLGAQWGLKGICIAWLIAYPIQFFILLRISLATLGTNIGDYLAAMRGPALASAVMYTAVLLCRTTVTEPMFIPAVDLAILAAAGAFAYVSVTWISQRPTYSEAIQLLRP